MLISYKAYALCGLVLVFLILLVSVPTALAQYPGSEYPGGSYPGGYPGSYPGGGDTYPGSGDYPGGSGYPGGSDPYPGGYPGDYPGSGNSGDSPGGGYPGDGSGSNYPGSGGYPGGGSSSGSGGYPGSNWQAVQCNADGSTPANTSPDDADYSFMRMEGTQTFTGSNTYPQAPLGWSPFCWEDPSQYPYDGTPMPTQNGVVGDYSSGTGYSAFNYASTSWSMMGGFADDSGQGHLIVGGLTVHADGHLHAYYKWVYQGDYGEQTDPPVGSQPPDHIDLLVLSHAYATASNLYKQSTQSSGLTTTASASVLGLTANVDGSHAAVSGGADAQSLSSYHLVRLATSGTSVADYALDVTTDVHAKNLVPYGVENPDYPGYYDASVGPTEAYADATATAATKIAGISLGAHSTKDTGTSDYFPWDETHPRFFSGTNCTAHGSIDVDKSLIDRAELTVECGVDIATISYPDPTVPTRTPNLGVTFDSTHGADTSIAKITYKVWDKAGDPPMEKTLSAPIKNTAYVLANNTLGDDSAAMYAVSIMCPLMNYSVNPTDQDNEATILDTLPLYTVFYAHTHADSKGFGDCLCPSPGSTWDNFVWFDQTMHQMWNGGDLYHKDVSNAVARKTIFQPPYNFVQLDGCEGAGMPGTPSNIAGSFGISGPDRAVLAWQNEMAISDENTQWTHRLWENLSNGDNILIAAVKSSQDGEPSGELDHGVSTSYGDIAPVIIGDSKLKLHGVYGGVSGDQWILPLP